MRKSLNLSPLHRRTVLQAGTLALLLGTRQIARGASIVAVRIWPAQDYSRVTIESDQPLATTQQFVPEPPRLAVDIEGMDLNAQLRELVGKVRPDDPNIAAIRIGQYQPGVVRMVLDLKHAARPQVFSLPPVAAYRNRLVLDLYPAEAPDPLSSLIAERTGASANAAAPAPEAASDPLGELIASRPRTGAQPPAGARTRGRARHRPHHHRRARSWSRRRRPGCDRPAGHAREGRGAQGGLPAARPHQRHPHRRQPDAGLSDARRRFLRAAGHPRGQGAARAGRPVRLHPRRCLHHARRARRQRLRAQPGRRIELGRALAREQGKPGRPDRRRERRRT